MSAFVDLLREAAKAVDVACLRVAGDDAARIQVIARELMKPAQDAGIAVLVDNADLAGRLGADGVHLADPKDYTSARKALGDRLSVGVACPLERHVAMEAGEAGADYVQFAFDPAHAEDALDLFAWWAEVMTVPSVIACPPDPAIAAVIAAAGADFLAPDASLWSQPDPVALLKKLIPVN